MVQSVVTSLLKKEVKKMPKEPPMVSELLDKLNSACEAYVELSAANRKLRAEVNRLNKVVQALREKLDRSEVTLQPCPFCGNTDITLSYADPKDTCRLFCTKCGAEVDFGVSKGEAVKLWNTRAETPKVVDTYDEYP